MYRRLARHFYGFFDGLKGRRSFECQKSLDKTQFWKKSDLEKLKLFKLRALLKYAYENVPYYNQSFKESGVSADDLKSLKDLVKFPVLTKSVIRERLEDITAKNFPHSKLILWKTSGTTAMPVKFYRDRLDLSWAVGAELRGYGWAGYRIGDKIGRIWSFTPEETRRLSYRLEELFGREKTLNVKSLSERSMESFAGKMKRFRPDFIRGYSSTTNTFANFLIQNNHDGISPKAVFTSSATLYPHYRKTIEKVFNCKIYDYYACNEISHIAVQCGHNDGLHVCEENVLVETVDGEETVASGEEGKILLTNLNARGMPIIRYDVGDVGTMLADSCSCGRELRLMSVSGRTYEQFLHSDGSFTMFKDFKTFFGDMPIVEFQIIQEDYDDILIKIVPRPEYDESHTDFIVKNIKLRGPARIRVELVDSIELGPSGKIERVVSKFGGRYGYFGREAPSDS
jgi:phenylacetate-CoA ligase